MKTDLFQSCGHCWVFQICWHIECSSLTASCASVRSIPFMSFFCAHLHMKCSLVVSNFLVEVSSLSHSIAFLFFLWSLRKSTLSLLAILWNSAFRWVYLSFYSLPFTSPLLSAICKASSDNHFALLYFFFWGWFWSLSPVQCLEPPFIILQALYQIWPLESICYFHCLL